MSVQRIAARYAKSLIDLASEQNVLDAVVEDMQHFQQVASVRDFLLLLKSPIVHTSTKRNVFKKLFADDYQQMTRTFFDIVLRKGREPLLPEICNEFVAQYRAMKQISLVTLKTAAPLSENSLTEIKRKISEAQLTRSNVELASEVDESLLGGFVLEFEDKQYDVSVAHKLEEMRRTFSS